VVTHLEDADIIMVIKKGSRMKVELGGTRPFPGGGPIADGLANADLLTIYPGRTDEPLRQPVLWSDREKDGLKMPELKAFQKFRKQVEESEKPPKP
jgi:hypothetical protein